jgi:hypothetical protein
MGGHNETPHQKGYEVARCVGMCRSCELLINLGHCYLGTGYSGAR